MSFCFAIGIPNRTPPMQRASGVRVVEYIQYNIRDKDTDSIDIVGDLFLPNPEETNKIFSFIHPGNIDIKSLKSDLILAPNNFYTTFLQKLYASSVNSKFERETGRFFGLGASDVNIVDISGTNQYCGTLLRKDKANGPNIPFSLYQIEIPKHTHGFARVYGKITGDTLKKLTKGKTSFDVYGGEVLLDLIRSEYFSEQVPSNGTNIDTIPHEEYRGIFYDFVNNSYIEPERYDLVLRSTPGTRQIKAERLSRDLFLGCEECILQKNRIDWYWSQSARFYVSSYQNGLRVGVTLSKSDNANM